MVVVEAAVDEDPNKPPDAGFEADAPNNPPDCVGCDACAVLLVVVDPNKPPAGAGWVLLVPPLETEKKVRYIRGPFVVALWLAFEQTKTYREFAAPVLIVRPPGPLTERASDIVTRKSVMSGDANLRRRERKLQY